MQEPDEIATPITERARVRGYTYRCRWLCLDPHGLRVFGQVPRCSGMTKRRYIYREMILILPAHPIITQTPRDHLVMSFVTPTSNHIQREDVYDDVKDDIEHIEGGSHHDKQLGLEAAIAADHAEHELGILPALKQYKAAVFWSITVSMCIVSDLAVYFQSLSSSLRSGHGRVRSQPFRQSDGSAW